MNTFKLEPGDVIVNVNDRNDPFSVIKRWAISSPYEHVFMYLGKARIIVDPKQNMTLRFPLLFESNGRGVVLQSLSNRYGQKVVVMRLKSEFDRKRIPKVLREAVKLASDERSYYDYFGIVKFVLPRLIFGKLGLPMPLSWHRDERQICSEAVFEVFDRAKLPDILRFRTRVPLPGDFVTDSTLLEQKWVGILSEDLISLEGHTEEGTQRDIN